MAREITKFGLVKTRRKGRGERVPRAQLHQMYRNMMIEFGFLNPEDKRSKKRTLH